MAFFAALGYNNDRAFFEENRELYENYVRRPLIALAEALGPVVQAIDPLLDIRPGRVVSRINRDLRFSKDKTPYRDYMWIGYRRTGETREETCGFYFDLSATAANWGCGYYHMQPQTMKNLRRKLIREPRRVQKIIEDPAFTAAFSLMGDAYVRQYQPPEGMTPSLAALYRRKTVYAEHPLRDISELFSPDLADTIAADFKTLAPFYAFLRECMIVPLEDLEQI